MFSKGQDRKAFNHKGEATCNQESPDSSMIDFRQSGNFDRASGGARVGSARGRVIFFAEVGKRGRKVGVKWELPSVVSGLFGSRWEPRKNALPGALFDLSVMIAIPTLI